MVISARTPAVSGSVLMPRMTLKRSFQGQRAAQQIEIALSNQLGIDIHIVPVTRVALVIDRCGTDGVLPVG